MSSSTISKIQKLFKNKENAEESSSLKEFIEQINDGTFDMGTLPKLFYSHDSKEINEIFNNEELQPKIFEIASKYFGTDKIYVGNYDYDNQEPCPYEVILGDVVPFFKKDSIVLPNTQIVFGNICGYFDPQQSKVKYVISANVGDSKTTGNLRCVQESLSATTENLKGIQQELAKKHMDSSSWDELSIKNLEYVGRMEQMHSHLVDTDALQYCGGIHQIGYSMASINPYSTSDLQKFCPDKADMQHMTTVLENKQIRKEHKIDYLNTILQETRREIMGQNRRTTNSKALGN